MSEPGEGREAYNPAGARPGMNPAEESERNGHAVRSYKMAISVGALALAWTRQEQAPAGATVVADREVSPLGRLAKVWTTPAEKTLAMAVVIRPPLAIEEADAIWLLASLAAAEGAEVASGRPTHTRWPDHIVQGEDDELVAVAKAEIQLGPGKVRSAVLTLRFDLPRLGLAGGQADRLALLDAVLASLDVHLATTAEGATAIAAAYQSRCSLLGQRIKVRLLPKGETRGVPRGVDRMGRLEMESPSGMVERLTIDTLREYQVV
ncbi:MAG: hypothetical protein ACRDZW_02500 [Acidimicrobiales bacterium]